MKTLSLLCFAATLGAAEVPTPDAKPREVTVYADRAEVVRIFQGDLAAGDQSLLFDNLPANVDFSSIRVEGTGAFTLIDIRPETLQVKEVANEAIRALQAKIQAQEGIGWDTIIHQPLRESKAVDQAEDEDHRQAELAVCLSLIHI